MDIVESIRIEAQEFFSQAKGSHDWEHTERVYNLCLHICKHEDLDIEVLKIAAILHDIGRVKQDESQGKVCHAEFGAQLAKSLLLKYSLSQEKIDHIIHCIITHRFRGENIPGSIEAKVLFDADKLDSIGAVGIGRAFLFAGEIGANLHDKNVDINTTMEYSKDDTAYREYLIKLIKIKDRMLTAEGKRLATDRHEFMTIFFERLNKEVMGEI